MTYRMVQPDPQPDDLYPAVDALIERLRTHYPDMSGFTAVSMTGRGRDFLHHLVHTRIGGLLPIILSFEDYRTRRIAEATGRTAVPEDEAFLRFHALRCGEEGRSLPPADTQRLLSFLTTIAEFSVSIEELHALDRIGPEQLARIDRVLPARLLSGHKFTGAELARRKRTPSRTVTPPLATYDLKYWLGEVHQESFTGMLS